VLLTIDSTTDEGQHLACVHGFQSDERL